MKPKRPRNLYLILMLGSLTALSPFSIDMYLPAFQIIAADFSVQVSDVSLSLSSYFIGLAFGQLIYGPLLDRFGRRPPLFVGLIIYIFASLCCMFSPSLSSLIFFRLIQALGGCVAQVAAIAMVRDFFEGKESAKIFSLLILILGASPLLAPTSGAYLAANFGWHSVFLMLTVLGLLLLAVSYYFLPEGHQPDPTQSLRIVPIFRNYFSILVHPQFYTYTLAGALAFSGLFVYLASSPIIFLEIFHIQPETYGWIFGILATGFISSSQFNILLMKKFTSEQILLRGILCLTAIGFCFALGTMNGIFGLVGTILMLFMYLSSAGMVHPNASSLALLPFSKNAGSASALMGAIQMGIGALVTIGVGLLNAKAMLPFTLIFASTGLIAMLVLVFGKQKILSHNSSVATLE